MCSVVGRDDRAAAELCQSGKRELKSEPVERVTPARWVLSSIVSPPRRGKVAKVAKVANFSGITPLAIFGKS